MLEQVKKIINGREYTINLMSASKAYNIAKKIILTGDEAKQAMRLALSYDDNMDLLFQLFSNVTFKNENGIPIAIEKENFDAVFHKRLKDINELAESVAEANFQDFFSISQPQ